jgi:hypothetical protein
MRTPTQVEFVECWSEVIVRNGLPPALVDDPLFRKVLVTTSHMDQTTVYMDNFATSRYIHQENYWDMDAVIKKNIWSVMEDFAKAPGDKDLTKMKTQYQTFVDTVGSKQVTV